MKFLSWFLKIFETTQNEEPQNTVEIEGLGLLHWSEDDECWIGQYKDYKFSIAYDGLAGPKKELEDSVKRTFADEDELQCKLERIKALAKQKYAKSMHKEIECLQPRDIIFQDPEFILIQYFGPHDSEPFWFAEIRGEEINVGYDT